MISEYLRLGQSGQKIEIVGRGNSALVRKSSPTPEGSARLEAAFQKHQFAIQNGNMAPLSVPEIAEDFDGDGYSMTLVHGHPLGAFLTVASPEEVILISSSIAQYFENNSGQAPGEKMDDAFSEKLYLLRDTFAGSKDPVIRAEGAQTLDKFAVKLRHLPRLAGWNHGDLSLENLLYDRNEQKLVAVDFLDSPAETILIDFGRLWLDMGSSWWGHGVIQSPVFHLNLMTLRNTISEVARGLGLSEKDLDVLAGFAAMRVLPYTVNPLRLSRLKNALRKINK